MNWAGVMIFTFLSYGIGKTMVLVDTAQCIGDGEGCLNVPSLDMASFLVPFDHKWNPEFKSLSDGIDIVIATQNIAIAIIESFEFLGNATVWLFAQLFAILQLMGSILEFLVFFLEIIFTTVPGAPWFINVILLVFPAVAIFIVIGVIQGAKVA